MKILCHFKDGSFTVGRPRSVLLHWYWTKVPQHIPEDPKPLTVYQVGPPINMKDLLMLAVAAAERTYGSAPEIDQLLSTAAVDYDDKCLEFIGWLKDRGDVTGWFLNPTSSQIADLVTSQVKKQAPAAEVDETPEEFEKPGKEYSKVAVGVLVWVIAVIFVLICICTRL